MDARYSDNRPELIHCDTCGEDYAATYKRCPFCNTAPNGKKAPGGARKGSRSGDRVRTNTRGGGYGGSKSPLSIIGIVLSIILIVAAVVIVAVLVRSALSGSKGEAEGSSASTSEAASTGEDGTDEDEEESTMVVAPDSVTLDQTSAALAEGETLALTATIAPSGWVGQTIWTTSDSSVATVDSSGVVTYVADGTCTITASAGGVTADCTVVCGSGVSTGDATGEDDSQSSIEVTAYGSTNDGDFTFNVGETVPFKATGGDGSSYTWSIADASIASVTSDGSCTGLAEGKTTMTVTSGGESVTVIIRIKAAS